MCFGPSNTRLSQGPFGALSAIRPVFRPMFQTFTANTPEARRAAAQETFQQGRNVIQNYKAQHQNPGAPVAPQPTQGSGLAGLFGPPQ
jgi:hypothetical protein